MVTNGRERERSPARLPAAPWVRLSALTALPVFWLLLHAGLAHEDCLSLRNGKLDECTKPFADMSVKDTIDSLVDACRRTRQVPVCLENVIDECQNTSDPHLIDMLRNATIHWRRKFDRLCATIMELDTGHAGQTLPHSHSHSHAPQPGVVLFLTAAALRTFLATSGAVP